MKFLQNLQQEYEKQNTQRAQLQPGSAAAKKAGRTQGMILVGVGTLCVIAGAASWYFTGVLPRISLIFAITIPLGLYSIATGHQWGGK